MSFKHLGLRAELLRAVSAQGYEHPTPIQTKAIPLILKGGDVLGGAQTGTGKTAAFTLPMIQILGETHQKTRQPRALILTPTRELANQIHDSIKTYGANMPLRSSVIFGGVGINPQIAQLRRGIDILVATPGRLLDHLERKTLDLSKIRMFVLDEADRMLDMGFIHDIRKIIKTLPQKRQTLMFSATYSREITVLAQGILKDHATVDVSPQKNSVADSVVQRVHPVQREQKRELLSYLIKNGGWTQVLVFTRTKHMANTLTRHLLAQGVSAAAIHGNKSQANRTKALSDFKRGTVRTLVATDIASRGLDIYQLPHVVNYELPHVPEDYVHRIGRTGRAGAQGIALSLVCADEQKQLSDIQRMLKHTIPVEQVTGFSSNRKPQALPRPQTLPRPQAQPRPQRPGRREEINPYMTRVGHPGKSSGKRRLHA